MNVEIVAPRLWGPWATLGWMVLGIATWIAVGTIVAIPFFFARLKKDSFPEMERVAAELETDSLVISISALLTMAAILGYVTLLSRWRGWTAREYLAVTPIPTRATLWSIVALVAYLAAIDLTTYLMGRDVVPPFIFAVLKSGNLPLLCIALLVGAPVGEELLFRGFAFRGLVGSIGPCATIVLTSLSWSFMHIQYEAYHVFTIFLGGLMLGAIRHVTGSTSVTIVLHAIQNLIATIEALILAP